MSRMTHNIRKEIFTDFEYFRKYSNSIFSKARRHVKNTMAYFLFILFYTHNHHVDRTVTTETSCTGFGIRQDYRIPPVATYHFNQR